VQWAGTADSKICESAHDCRIKSNRNGRFESNRIVKASHRPGRTQRSGNVAWPRKFGSPNMSTSWTTNRSRATDGLITSNSHNSDQTGLNPLSAVHTHTQTECNPAPTVNRRLLKSVLRQLHQLLLRSCSISHFFRINQARSNHRSKLVPDLVPAKGRRRSATRKVTVGLASHWPCVTDSVVYPPKGSTTLKREMSTPPTLQRGTADYTLPYHK